MINLVKKVGRRLVKPILLLRDNRRSKVVAHRKLDERLLWMKKNEENGVRINYSIQLTGSENPYEKIDFSKRVVVEKDVTVWIAPYDNANPNLVVGTETYIGRNVFFNVYFSIIIGDYVQIAPYCYLTSANHGYSRETFQ